MPPRQRSRSSARSGRSSGPSETTAALVALIIVALAASGAFLILSRRRSQPPISLLVGADVTGSVHTQDRHRLFGVLDETVSSVLPHGATVAIWSYDVNAHQFGVITPSRPEDLWADEDAVMAQHTSAVGTYPGRAFQEMLASVEDAAEHHEGTAIMMLTDGEDQDPSNTVAEAKSLAQIPDLRAVWFAGVTSNNGFRSSLERRLTPILGDRLVVSGKYDTSDGLARFHKLISGANSNG